MDLRFAKPLDEVCLVALASQYSQWYVISDSAKIGGVGSMILELKERKKLNVSIQSFEYSDTFITHGATHLIEDRLEISASHIASKILEKKDN